MVLLDALSTAAAEITSDLAPGSVEVRLRGRDPEFVVTPPAAEPPVDDRSSSEAPPLTVGATGDTDEGSTSRVTLRLPESLKGSVDLPTASRLTAETALGQVAADGELGACEVKTAMGNIRLDQTGKLHATTGFGNVTVDHVVGDADIHTGSGEVRAGTIDGAA